MWLRGDHRSEPISTPTPSAADWVIKEMRRQLNDETARFHRASIDARTALMQEMIDGPKRPNDHHQN